ncbi:hypothetical protein V8B97DRAFT_1913907 [Scleroderma yunnanense]
MYDTQVIPVPGRCMRGVEVAGLHGPTPTGAVQLSTWTVHSMALSSAQGIRNRLNSWTFFVGLYSYKTGYTLSLSDGIAWSFYWIISYMNIRIQGPMTLAFHCTRLVVNVIGDEEMWRCTTEKKGAKVASWPLAPVFGRWLNVVLSYSKPIYSSDARLGNVFLATISFDMFPVQILNLAGVLFVFALTFTFVAYRRPSGPQPAAYCHVQTNCEPDRQIVTRDVVGGQTHVQLPVAHCSFDKRVQVMFHSRRLESRTRFVPTGAVGGHRYSSDELDNKAHSERFPETSSTEVASRLVAVLPLFPGSMELITFALMHTADQGRQIKEYQWNDVPLPFTTRSSKSNTQRLGFDLITEVFHPQSERTCAKIPQGHPGASTLELRRDSRRRPRALYYGPLHRQTQAHPREYVLQTNEIAYCAEKGVALTASGPRLRLELQESEELSSPLVVFLDMRRHRTFEVRR